MFNKKIRKLMRDPKLFFSDMAIKRRNSIDILKPKENNGHYQYTIVSAVYNVGRYLDEYITSVTKQRLDFKKHIQLILVDDGSTDDSATIIKKWQKKHPNNIHYFYKDNGGQASARNLGMKHVNTEWVTFTDPDDILDQDYFYQVDVFAHKHKNNNMVMLCNNFIYYFEDEHIYKDAHPLKYRFSKGDAVNQVNELGKNMQLAVNSAIFKSEVIFNKNIEFDSRIKPNFEDAHFVGSYLAGFKDGHVGFVSKAKYYYRKRSDGTSTLDTAWEKKGLYDDVLVHGCIDMFSKYINTQDSVPKHIQRTVLYHLIWYFKRLVNNKQKTEFLSERELNKFKSLVSELFNQIDAETIMEFELAGCWFYHKVAFLGLFKKMDPPFQIVYVESLDKIKGMVKLRYFSRQIGLEIFNIGGMDVIPCFAKSMMHEFLGDSFVIERRVWVPISPEQQASNATLKVSIGDMVARISFAGKQHNNGVSYNQIATHFESQKPNYKIDKKFQSSWLLMDRDTQADDNAEHLYRYIKNNHPEQKIYFVLRRESHDWQRLEQDGFQVLAFGESEHETALKSCDKVISSHADGYVSNYLGPKMLEGRHFVFLQHGVIQNDLSGWLNTKNIDCFVTTSPFEYASISADNTLYKFGEKEVVLTGLPRHDALLSANNTDKKILLIMPTWRNNIVGKTTGDGNIRLLNPDFMDTTFARHWSSLLHNQRLADICNKHGFKVVFFPHPNIQPYLNQFELPDYVEIFSHATGSIQDIFCNATMMMTDYSSVAFEMAYLEKPTLYYQFDETEVFSGSHTFKQGYFDYRLHGFGPVAVEESYALDELEVLLQRNGQPDAATLTRMQETFPYRDGKNCERVYQAILALDVPHNPETINIPILLGYAEQASKAKLWPLAEQRWSQIYALMDETYHSAACLNLATSLRNQGKFSEAWSHFDEYEAWQAMRNQPLIGEALAEKAELLMASGSWEQAAQIWAELQLSGKGYIPTRHLHCQLAMEDWAGVSQQISSPAFSLLSMHEQICCTAVIDSAKGEWQQVIEQLSEAIMQFTTDELRTLKPELLLAQAYRELGDFDAAHQQLLGYERHTKSDSTCRREIALLAFARGDFTKAHKQLAQAFPDRNDLPLSLAAIYLKSLRKAKQIDLAIEMAVWLRANHQTDVNIMMEAGKIALMAKHWEIVADIWSSLIGVLDDAPYKLALALRMLGDIESAQKYLDDSNSRPPCNMDEWILKAEIAHLNGCWQQAAMCWRELLRLYPTQAPDYCWERMAACITLGKNYLTTI